jgi:hypothetical protein
MRMMMFLLMAAVAPSAIWAQTKTPAAPNANAQPGQGSPKLGANLCGHVIDAGTFVDARAQNASHEEAVVMRWLDPKGTAVHSALFMGRCVAKDGDTIDGKLIVRVLPNSLAVSDRHAISGWEAEFWSSSGEQAPGRTPHRGVFSDGRFVTELDPGKASEVGTASNIDPDFRWNEEEEILALKPGIVLVPSPLHYTYATAPPPSNAQAADAKVTPAQAPAPAAKPNCTPQAPQGPRVNVKTPPKASAWACQHLGICSDNKPVPLNGDSGCPAAPASGQPAK